MGVVIGIGAGFHAGPLNELALFLEADVGYYALPWLVTSLAVEGAESNSEYGVHYESWLAAARAAAHPFAGFVVDPWVALDVGHAWARVDYEDGTYGDRDTVFVAGGIGVDVLAFDTAAFGLAMRHRIGFADRLGDQLGLRLEARL